MRQRLSAVGDRHKGPARAWAAQGTVELDLTLGQGPGPQRGLDKDRHKTGRQETLRRDEAREPGATPTKPAEHTEKLGSTAYGVRCCATAIVITTTWAQRATQHTRRSSRLQ